MELSEGISWAWKNCPEYTVLDLAFLACYQEPVDFNSFYNNQNPLCLNYLRKLRDILFDDNPEFKSYVCKCDNGGERNRRLCLTPIGRKKAVELLNQLVGEHNFLTERDSQSPIAHIDPKHPMISNEFKIAMEAWTAVLASNPNKPKTGSRKKLIEEWLEQHYPKLTAEAKKRIATLLNPDANGGAPPSC